MAVAAADFHAHLRVPYLPHVALLPQCSPCIRTELRHIPLPALPILARGRGCWHLRNAYLPSVQRRRQGEEGRLQASKATCLLAMLSSQQQATSVCARPCRVVPWPAAGGLQPRWRSQRVGGTSSVHTSGLSAPTDLTHLVFLSTARWMSWWARPRTASMTWCRSTHEGSMLQAAGSDNADVLRAAAWHSRLQRPTCRSCADLVDLLPFELPHSTGPAVRNRGQLCGVDHLSLGTPRYFELI